MGISVSKYTFADAMREYLNKRKKKVAKALLYVGSEAVDEQRDAHKYKDRTGNLTSSIGCVAVMDGKVVGASDFESVKDGIDGGAQGQTFAQELADDTQEGVSLIVVAGMPYAKYVNDRGYDALDTAQLVAEKKIGKILSKIK